MAAARFFDSSPAPFRYWSGPLEDAGLERDIGSIDALFTTPTLKAVRGWFATPGVVAQLHYDTFRNVLVQVSGVKEVRLLPPSALQDVYIYPSLHPGYRQSQVPNVSGGGDAVRFPGFPAEQMATVILRPGEALYIPPFWLHQVTSLESTTPVNITTSVNVWCEDADLATAEAIFAEAIPFDDDWIPVAKSTALARYADILVAEVLGDSSEAPAAEFYDRWLRRYRPLLATRPPVFSPERPPEALDGGVYCDFGLPRQRKGRLEAAAREVAKLLAPLDRHVRTIFLQDLLEEMATFFVGREHVFSFGRSCLLRDTRASSPHFAL